MKRRDVLRVLGAAGIGGRFTYAQSLPKYTVEGSGPTIIAFDRMPEGYYKELADRYRVIVIS
jgi:hypothetical protein